VPHVVSLSDQNDIAAEKHSWVLRIYCQWRVSTSNFRCICDYIQQWSEGPV